MLVCSEEGNYHAALLKIYSSGDTTRVGNAYTQENTPRIHVKPQYRKINTIYTIISTLNKYKNICKRVNDHDKAIIDKEIKTWKQRYKLMIKR